MKITTDKKIDTSFLGERLIREYSYEDSTGESNDGMRRGYSYTVNCKVYGNISNETINEDGTYSYDYISRIEKDHDQYGTGERNPELSSQDLSEMTSELLFRYNIHEFSTNLETEPHNIKDYVVRMHVTTVFNVGKEGYIEYSWITIHKEKILKNPAELSKNEIIPDSRKSVQAKLDDSFTKEDYIWYLICGKLDKEYQIYLGLNDIGENETVSDFLNGLSVKTPEYSTFDQVLEEGIITPEDIKNTVKKYNNVDAKNIPFHILNELFDEDNSLITHFNEYSLPIELRRRYNSDFDINKVFPKDLLSSDLDMVLDRIIKNRYIFGLRLEQGEISESERIKRLFRIFNNIFG